MAKNRTKRKEISAEFAYFFSMIVTLAAHYFFLANLPINSTLTLFFSFLIFTILLGVVVIISKRMKKRN